MTQRLFKTLITLLFFFPLIVFAQKDEGRYYTGYIVNNSGDTIPGQLLKDTQYLRPEIISFRWNGEFQQFGQYDIRAFYIEELDLLFESHTITKNQDSNTETPIEGDISGKTATDKHFLLTLAKSQQEGVYSFRDDSGRLRLYFKSGNKIEELLVFRTYTFEGGVRIPQEKNRFRIQLLGLMIACTNLQKEINEALYSENSLKSLFIEYTKCTGGELIYTPRVSRIVFSFGITVGLGSVVSTDQSRGNILGLGIENARIRQTTHEGGNWFEFGLALRAKSSRDSRIAYKGELKFRQQSLKTVWNRPIPVSNIVSRAIYTYDNTNVMLNFLFDLNLLERENLLVFAEGGISLATSLSQKMEISEGVFNGTDYTFTEMNSDDHLILDSDLSFIVGFGVQLKRTAFSLRYSQNFGGNLNEENGVAMKHGSLSLNAVYNFR